MERKAKAHSTSVWEQGVYVHTGTWGCVSRYKMKSWTLKAAQFVFIKFSGYNV